MLSARVAALRPDPNNKLWPLLLGVLLLQLFLQSSFFPLSALTDASLLRHIDAPFHQYQMEVAQALCAQGNVVGYDPRFAAGQLGGVNFNASGKVPALFACALGQAVPVATVYKFFSFVSGVAAPAALLATCMFFNLSRLTTVLVAVFALLLWWTGAMRWYHTAGMTSFVLASFVGIPTAVWASRVCVHASAARVLGLGLVTALGMFLHPLFALGVFLAGLPMVLGSLAPYTTLARALAAAALAAALMLAINSFWIIPSLGPASYSGGEQPYQRAVEPALAWLEMLGRAPTAAQGSRLYLVLVIGAALCLGFCRSAHRRAMLCLLLGSALLMAWASLGGLSKTIAVLQPNRFSAMAWLCLVLPAAEGFTAALLAWRTSMWPLKGVIAVSMLAGLLVTGKFVQDTINEVFSNKTARYGVMPPEAKAEGDLSRNIVAYLKTRTDHSGRVFFEQSLGRIHDGGHQAGHYAWAADREFIGGPYPFTDFASAWDGVAFGAPIDRFTAPELTRLLDHYNVAWMLCHTDACKRAMAQLPDTTQDGHGNQLGSVTAFRRSQAPGFVVEGQAQMVARCTNRLELAKVQGQRLVLRYHWVPGLTAYPSGVVEPVNLVPGARPFIAVLNPPSTLSLGIGNFNKQPCPTAKP